MVRTNNTLQVISKAENFNGKGTLKHFTQRVKTMRLRMVRKWSRQILEGLGLSSQLEPPIIHRDLKCDNIFINKRRYCAQT